MSKLSDKEKREVLVDQLITKINKEIDQYIKETAKNLISFSDEIDQFDSVKEIKEDFIEFCNEVTICSHLKNMVNRPGFFMDFHMSDGKNDFISYVVSDKHIDMWLDPDFNFIHNVLFSFGLDIFFKTERSFELDLCSCIEDALYAQKLKEREEAAGKEPDVK